jgi:Skp family chaperone for outer membrane proteins
MFVVACTAQPSPEDLKVIQNLRDERESVQAEIAAAEEKTELLAGGLVKALTEARLEILRTTEALLQQRIHALESGARIEVVVPASEVDADLAQRLATEIAGQSEELDKARQDAARYSGGLVAAMKSTTVATHEQTLALLKQRYLAALYGLPMILPQVHQAEVDADASPHSTVGVQLSEDTLPAQKIIEARLTKKNLTNQDYQDYVFFDVLFTAVDLEKPARAIKGVLHLQDLFGEARMDINWTIDVPLKPGESTIVKGTGFNYNQFIDSHQWVRSTKLENMTASMTVTSVLFQDGTRRDF